MKMTKEDLVRGLGFANKGGDSSKGNKVLPITEYTPSSSSSLSSSSSSSSLIRSHVDEQKQSGPSDQVKKGKVIGESNGNKNKALVRMMEFLRWTTIAKYGRAGKIARKGLHFRNRSATIIKSRAFDEELLENDSPKISIKWEVESCSTTCSAASAPQFTHHNTWSWITTDDQFVVLEL